MMMMMMMMMCSVLLFPCRYKERIHEALRRNSGTRPTVLSMIMDGMDQNHCHIPYAGTQQSFSNPLKQCIVGVKEHGLGFTVYRTIDTIKKGANLTIHIFLMHLESWRNRNGGVFPEEIFLQVDGGCENANRHFLGYLELLVVKRMCRAVYFTRLPTGHTHEDIDACFGVVWRLFRGQSCLTLGDFKNLIETYFRTDDGLGGKVEDIYVIPDYTPFIDPVLDGKIARLHKEDQTQHQWRFEAVPRSADFPLGCKTCFRAYSSDKVVEFTIKPRQQCQSSIGRVLGLEPCTTYCRWYPTEHCIPGRAVEGFYLLKDIPHHDEDVEFPPVEFVVGSYIGIKQTLREINRRFSWENDYEIRCEWENWTSLYAPPSDNVRDFLDKIYENPSAALSANTYHFPLNFFIWNKRMFERSTAMDVANGVPFSRYISEDPTFQWPELLCAAMNSVVSEFTPHPHLPRVHVSSNAELNELMDLIKSRTVAYYEDALPRLTLQVLTSRLFEAKMGYSGIAASSTGKALLITILLRVIR